MVRYTSRVGKTTRAKAPKKGAALRTGGKLKTLEQLADTDDASIGGASGSVIGIDTGGEIAPASLENAIKAEKKGAALRTGGELVGGALSTGGKMKKKKGAGLTTGGGVTTGGDLPKLFQKAKAMVDNMEHPDMINVLQHMSMPEFGLLQGIASSHIGNAIHPMKNLVRKHLGGKFIHPKDVSRVATKDIIKGTQHQLIRALHDEYLDKMSGRQVGGGLLSSLKSMFLKGLGGFNSKLDSGIKIARKFDNILKKASQFAAEVAPSLKTAFPQQAGLIEAGVAGIGALEKGLEKGISVAEKAKGVGQVAEGFAQAAQEAGDF